MQIEQSLRELLWNPEMVAGLPKLVIGLGIAALLGVILGQVYIHFGQGQACFGFRFSITLIWLGHPRLHGECSGTTSVLVLWYYY